MNSLDRRLNVAPMMEWTDRHCRYLHRLFAPHALLYTEMIVASAIVRGDARRLLALDPAEHPVALQLGGSDPEELALAARIGEAAGYAEINLNVGCPSDRVRSGSFGACLMLRPRLVADCIERIREAVRVPVTVKCRIGVDARDTYEFFAQFVDAIAAAGIDALIVHARAAILGGLTPKENREIPPLKYDYVHRLKRERPDLAVVLNGGLGDLPSILAHCVPKSSAGGSAAAGGGAAVGGSAAADGSAAVHTGLDGIMVGRAAYHRPHILAELETALIDPGWIGPDPEEVIERMVCYARGQTSAGVRLHSITRHMQGLISGQEGARAWRRFLSDLATRQEAPPEALFAGLPILRLRQAA